MSLKEGVRELGRKYLGIKRCPLALLHKENLIQSCETAVDCVKAGYDSWSEKMFGIGGELLDMQILTNCDDGIDHMGLCLEEFLEIEYLKNHLTISDGHRHRIQQFIPAGIKNIMANVTAFIRDHYNQTGSFPSLDELYLMEEDLVENQESIGGVPAAIAQRIRNVLSGLCRHKKSEQTFDKTTGEIKKIPAIRAIDQVDQSLEEGGVIPYDAEEGKGKVKLEDGCCPALLKIPDFTRVIFRAITKWYSVFLESELKERVERDYFEAANRYARSRSYEKMNREEKEEKPYRKGSYRFYEEEYKALKEASLMRSVPLTRHTS